MSPSHFAERSKPDLKYTREMARLGLKSSEGNSFQKLVNCSEGLRASAVLRFLGSVMHFIAWALLILLLLRGKENPPIL